MGAATSKRGSTFSSEPYLAPDVRDAKLSLNDIWSQFEVEKSIGKGGFGEVFAVYPKMGNRSKIVLKQIDMGALLQTNGISMDDPIRKKIVSQMLSEIEIWPRLDHANVLRCLGCPYVSEDIILIACEYATGGDLSKFLYNRIPMQEMLAFETVKRWSMELLLGLQCIHSLEILHRDIKPENILLFGEGENATLKLADFGLCRYHFDEGGNTPCDYLSSRFRPMSVRYAAPEFVCKSTPMPRTFSYDIWSLGVVFYYMKHLKLPFAGRADFEVVEKIKHYTEDPDKLFGNIESLPENEQYFERIIRRMMEPHESSRASLAAIIEEEFYKEFSESSIQLISFDQNDREKLVFHHDSFADLIQKSPLKTSLPCVTISISGSYRTGKSLFMSLLVRYFQLLEQHGDPEKVLKMLPKDKRPLTEFKAQAGSKAITTGIRIWSRPYVITTRNDRKVAVYLIDSEGTSGLSSTESTDEIKRRDLRNLILTSLISSVSLFNIKGQIKADDVDLIAQFSELLKLLAVVDDEEAVVHEKILQNLIFVNRDFAAYEIENSDSEDDCDYPKLTDVKQFGFGAARKYVEEKMGSFEVLNNYFGNVDFFAVPLPGDRANDKREMDNKLKVSHLNGVHPFVGCVCELGKWLAMEGPILSRPGFPVMDFNDLTAILLQYISAMNQHDKNLPALCHTIADIRHQRAVAQWFRLYCLRFDDEMHKAHWGKSTHDFVMEIKLLHEQCLEYARRGLLCESLPMKSSMIEATLKRFDELTGEELKLRLQNAKKHNRILRLYGVPLVLLSAPWLLTVSAATNKDYSKAVRLGNGIAAALLTIPSAPFLAMLTGVKFAHFKLSRPSKNGK